MECVHLFFISQLFILHILFLCDPVISSTLSFYSKEWTLLQLSGLLCSGSGGCSGFSSLPCSSYVSSLIPLLVADLQYLFLTSIIELIRAKFPSSVMAWGEREKDWSQAENRYTPCWELGKQTSGSLHSQFPRQNDKTTTNYLEILESLLVYWNPQLATDLESPIEYLS